MAPVLEVADLEVADLEVTDLQDLEATDQEVQVRVHHLPLLRAPVLYFGMARPRSRDVPVLLIQKESGKL